MIGALYVEVEAADHPLARDIRRRFARVPQITVERYTEVFNRRAQNFRLQKNRPALILARKQDAHPLPAPPGYGIGQARNFYFSHMLNCVYDCRYCFLQGMYRSAHYVLFVNYEDFTASFDAELAQAPGIETCFFSGYDGDSLALEPVTRFSEGILPFFAHRPEAWLELRTKSTQVRTLLKREPLANVVVAFSFTPAPVAAALEHQLPRLERRIEAMAVLQDRGWPLGLRFDPLIYTEDYQALYRDLFTTVFARLEPAALHSVSFGPFRLPRDFHRAIERLYPDERLFAGPFVERNGLVSYPTEREREMRDFCRDELLRYLPEERLFPCEV
jgi:spore photoproduct lyase